MTYELYEDFMNILKQWLDLRVEVSALKQKLRKAKKKKKEEIVEQIWNKQTKKMHKQFKLMKHPYFRYLMKENTPKKVWGMIFSMSVPKIEDKEVIKKLIW